MNAELSPSAAILHELEQLGGHRQQISTTCSTRRRFCVLWRRAKLSTLILDQDLPCDFRLPRRYGSSVWPALSVAKVLD
jgi:hypothetical protein